MERISFKSLEQRAAKDDLFVDYTAVAAMPGYAAVMVTVSDKNGKRIVRTGESAKKDTPLAEAFKVAGISALCEYYGIEIPRPEQPKAGNVQADKKNSTAAATTAANKNPAQPGNTVRNNPEEKMKAPENATKTDTPANAGINNADDTGNPEPTSGQEAATTAESSNGTDGELEGDFVFTKVSAFMNQKCSDMCKNNRKLVKNVAGFAKNGTVNPSIRDDVLKLVKFLEIHKGDEYGSWYFEK